MNNKKRILKTANEEILTKTQFALEAIKQYEAKNKKILDSQKQTNPFAVLKSFEKFDHLHYHKKLEPDQVVRVQLFPYSEDFYSFDMENCIFPVRIILRNVKNQTTLYVGYDIEFPGMPTKKDEEEAFYDYKSTFSEDKMITMKNPTKKHVKNVYLSFCTKDQLSMFSLKVDYIGYQGIDDKKQCRQIEGDWKLQRSKTETKQLQIQLPLAKYGSRNNSISKLVKQIDKRDRYEISALRRQYSERMDGDNFIQLMRRKKDEDFQKRKKTSFLASNYFNAKNCHPEKSKSLKTLKRQKKLQTQQRIKANKEAKDEFTEKNRQIREKSAKFKKLINEYEKNYIKDQKEAKGINKNVAAFIMCTIFTKKATKKYSKIAKSISSAFQIRFFIKKFSQKLMSNHVNNALMFSSTNTRLLMGPSLCLNLMAKTIQKKSVMGAGEVLSNTFQNLLSGLIINQVLEKASRFRRFVRKLQRKWKAKYHARLMTIENFSNRHVELMLKEYPHLKLAERSFRQGNYCHQVSYNYIHDESTKFKFIYEAFRHRMQEIDHFIEVNKDIERENEKLPENKRKNYLHVPDRPSKPQQRFFRNLDILKSMLRGWFELQYKKIVKKNLYNK